jgi:hypothetical protein
LIGQKLVLVCCFLFIYSPKTINAVVCYAVFTVNKQVGLIWHAAYATLADAPASIVAAEAASVTTMTATVTSSAGGL